jgi:putative ABC transport system permease protein
MSRLRHPLAIGGLAVKRLFSHLWLSLASLLGLVAFVALVTSVPLYTDGVYSRILQEEAVDNRGAYSPFALMFRYLGSEHGSRPWQEIEPVDVYLSGQVASVLGRARRLIVRTLQTDEFLLFPTDATSYKMSDALTPTRFVHQSELTDHISIVEGRLPEEAPPSSDVVVEVLVSEVQVMRMGFQVGETYTAFARRKVGEIESVVQVPVRITGVWKAKNRREEYWFYNPTAAIEDALIVPEEAFRGLLAYYEGNEVYAAVWYLALDESGFRISDVREFLSRLNAVQRRADALLPGTSLIVAPARGALQRYQRASGLLAVSLYAFSVPIVGMLLVFVGLVSHLSARRRRNETAVFRSRGATVSQVVGIAAWESLLLGAVALASGVPLAVLVARSMGRAFGFLVFAGRSRLQVEVTPSAMLFAVIAAVLALMARLAFTVGIAGQTIVSYRQDRARTLRPPWWRRAWLDVLAFLPAAYGAYLLHLQGGLVLPALDGEAAAGDAFYRNPLLFLVPAMWILVLTLFVLRILPPILALVSRGAARVRGTAALLAVRHLARTPRAYTVPLMLLILALGLSSFTASLAATLDRHLYEKRYFEVGADMRMVELGEDAREAALRERVREGDRTALDELAALDHPDQPGGEATVSAPRWSFLPVSEHLSVPGVVAAARVGRYEATVLHGGSRQAGTYVGIDRVDFPRVAYWRSDFAQSSLGALMNALALAPDGALLPCAYMEEGGLDIGDGVRVQVMIREQRRTVTTWTVDLDLRVVGCFDLFPTWSPVDETGRPAPLFVGNLDHLFGEASAQFPYDVWLETEPLTDRDQLEEDVKGLGIRVMGWESPLALIVRDLRRPERQGLFGLLSIGFVVSAALAVLGFLLHTLFSFRRRSIEFGVLRAIGLSVGQMARSIVWELLILISVALGAGTGIGVWASRLFVSELPLGTGPSAGALPLVVEIGWPTILRMYVLYGLLFLVAVIVLVGSLLQTRTFEAIKLGDTT